MGGFVCSRNIQAPYVKSRGIRMKFIEIILISDYSIQMEFETFASNKDTLESNIVPFGFPWVFFAVSPKGSVL